MDKELLKEYHERNIRWTDKSISQLSFFNNLLLSLAIVFLSFAYKDQSVQSTSFTLVDIDCSLTMSNFSMILILLSIISGLIVGISRLWDSRITRQINQIRQNMYEHSEKKLDEKTPQRYSFLTRLNLYKDLFCEFYPKITIEQCKEFRNFTNEEKQKVEKDFKELRTISYNLGLNTWRDTKIQLILLGIGITLYVVIKLI